MREESGNWAVFGTDLDPRWRDFDYGGAEVHVGSLLDANFPSRFFDVVTILDALYYVPDPLDELKEIFRILKPGGLLVIDVPNQVYTQMRGLSGRLLRIKRTAVFVAYPFYFSDKSIKMLLAKVGIDIVDCLAERGAVQDEDYLRRLMSFYCILLKQLTRIFPKIRLLSPRTVYIGLRNSRDPEVIGHE
jgi:SAM-dependent methyltransferase